MQIVKMESMFEEFEKENSERFIKLYKKYIDNPESEKIKEEANGLGIIGNPDLLSEDINEASFGSVKMLIGDLTLDEAKKILMKLEQNKK